MCKFSLNILLFLSLWLVCVSFQIQYHKNTKAEEGQQRYKEAIFKGMEFTSCLIINSMIKAYGKHHVMSCFVLDLAGSRGIDLYPHLTIIPITTISTHAPSQKKDSQAILVANI